MSPIETRGIWLTTTDSKVLNSKQRIAEAMDFLAETGFNVVFPVVWNQAVTLYPSQTMQQTFGVEIDPLCVGRDPLEEVVVEARRVGLKVIPWFEYGFASSYNLNGGVLLQKKPEWAARDFNGNYPNLLVAIAPNIYDWAFQEYLQDSPTWLKRGIVDMIQPQIYRRDFRSYQAIADKLVNQQFTDATLPKLAPGILMKLGSYCISPEYLVQAIEYNRQLGIQGEVFFFYEGLRQNNNTLAQVLRNGPYAKFASFPTLSDLSGGSVGNKRSSSIWQKLLKKIF